MKLCDSHWSVECTARLVFENRKVPRSRSEQSIFLVCGLDLCTSPVGLRAAAQLAPMELIKEHVFNSFQNEINKIILNNLNI